jgi:hypothetical protein
MPTTVTVITEATIRVVGKGSPSDWALGVGETSGVSEGKGNSDGSKEVEMGLVSGDWSVTPLRAYP